MAYVEYLRVRRALVTYAIVIFVTTALITVSLSAGHIVVNAHDLRTEQIKIPLTIAFAAALFGALIFGTLLSGSLNRERKTMALSWTRPVSRERMALTCMAVDFGGIVAAALITLAIGSIPLLTTGAIAKIRPDTHAFIGIALMLGVTIMWYGLLQAATSWYRAGAGLAIGLSWVLFSLLISIGHATIFGPIVSGVIGVVNYLNPLAYMSSYENIGTGGVDGQVVDLGLHVTSHLPLGEVVRTFATWCIGLVACAIAIFTWKNSEA